MVNIDIVEENCCQCKITFWITKKHLVFLKSNHDTFYCPNGHRFTTGKSDASQKLKDARRSVVQSQSSEITRLKEALAKKCRKPREKKS
jgi:hypothetical protein